MLLYLADDYIGDDVHFLDIWEKNKTLCRLHVAGFEWRCFNALAVGGFSPARMLVKGILPAGSPLLSREAWVELLGEAGFVDVAVAGTARAAAPLLSQQSVIAGVSDGAVRIVRSAPQRAAAPQGASAGAGRAGGAALGSGGRGAAAAAVLQVCLCAVT